MLLWKPVHSGKTSKPRSPHASSQHPRHTQRVTQSLQKQHVAAVRRRRSSASPEQGGAGTYARKQSLKEGKRRMIGLEGGERGGEQRWAKEGVGDTDIL
eukprot:6212898-Pleurochrysis_carterae.AAC.6